MRFLRAFTTVAIISLRQGCCDCADDVSPTRMQPPRTPKKYFTPTVFASAAIPTAQASKQVKLLFTTANVALEQTGEVRFATTSSGINPPTSIQFVAVDAACGIHTQYSNVDQFQTDPRDTLTEIFPFAVDPTGALVSTADGRSFVILHGLGTLQQGKKPGVVLFPFVSFLDANGQPSQLPEIGVTPEVGGATDIAGVIWISSARVTNSATSQTVLAHELLHFLSGLNHVQEAEWGYFLSLASTDSLGPYYAWDGHTGVSSNVHFTSTSGYGPVSTTQTGSQCDRMRANTHYLTDF